MPITIGGDSVNNIFNGLGVNDSLSGGAGSDTNILHFPIVVTDGNAALMAA